MSGRVTWNTAARRLVVVVAMGVGVGMASLVAGPALAHGEGESDRASVLVLQAIAFIANKPGDMDDIGDKVNDALQAPKKEGVDLTQIQAARDALDKGDMDQARTLLEKSLTSGAPMQGATGEETGTTVVHNALNTRGRLAGGDWILLALSVAVLVLGGWLAVRFRPAESVAALRRQLLTQPRGPTPES